VGYAEKVHLRGNLETVTAKAANGSARPNMSPVAPAPKRPVQKAVMPTEKQASLSDNLLMEMSRELKSLRTEMDSKLASIGWGGISKANPVRSELLYRLAGMSISRKLSVKIANRFTNQTDGELAFSQAQELLAKVLPVADDDLLQYGGIVALVGPTGVGKTTTIAKLAAKFILKHGPRQVALITTDNYRIGAHEQLNTYGRILDVPVRVASSAAELHNLINGFADKRLILIDTAGMSQRDMKLVEQINTLQQSDQAIKSYLVMSAATEYKAMNEIINAFQVFEPQASILTKLDEAATIGSAISSIIEHNLPLAFIADGQQVPEDMHSPCARTLIAQCVAELEQENDYNDVNNEAWVAQGYA
jgi:flagellar biosynthesis protein FlhF